MSWGVCGTGTREPGTSIRSLDPPIYQPKEHQCPRAPASLTPVSSHDACLSPKPQPGCSQAANTGRGYRTSCDSALASHTPTWPGPCPLFTVSGRAQAPPLAAQLPATHCSRFLEKGGLSEPWAATRRHQHACACLRTCMHVCTGAPMCRQHLHARHVHTCAVVCMCVLCVRVCMC